MTRMERHYSMKWVEENPVFESEMSNSFIQTKPSSQNSTSLIFELLSHSKAPH